MEKKEKTIKEVYDTFTDEQKKVVSALVGLALENAKKNKKENNHD